MDLNTVTISGNLTRDPELRTVGSGTTLCELRVAVNGREKSGEEWVDRPNYFDVAVWGRQGESAATYLEKGRAVAISGELRWREWKAEDGSGRQAVSITAERVKFLSHGNGGGRGSGNGAEAGAGHQPAAGSHPAAASVHEPPAQGQAQGSKPAAAGATEGDGGDDLPF